MATFTLGIDVACRAPHQASLADAEGRFVWVARRFRTTSADLDALWGALPHDAQLTVVLEPTRNAWVALAAWFRRRGAVVVLVPPEQSADLRDYYAKHTKSDRLDSKILARVPLLHPEGLRPTESLGPGEPMRRLTSLRSSLVKRRGVILARLDSYLEIMSPAWHDALRADLANYTALQFFAAGYGDPHVTRRLGRARLVKFLWRHSRGAWGDEHAERLLLAARETLEVWGEELDFDELAEDIAVEARFALALTREIKEIDERLAVGLAALDPAGILISVPGVGLVIGAQILARLGDPNRFDSLAGVRSFSGLVPSLTSSGLSGRHGGPTKSGDAALRESVFLAANWARRFDPTLAQRYHRLMVSEGKHHNSALCHVAAGLLTRIVACWRAQTPYQIRDLDGTVLTKAEGRAIVASRYQVSEALRASRRTTKRGTSRRIKESEAPSIDSSRAHTTTLVKA